MFEIYADNYVKPRAITILLIVLLLVLVFWAFIANITIFKPLPLRPLSGLSFCLLLVALVFFVSELFHRLWPVRTRRLKDGTKVTRFYLGWGKEIERTEFADGRCSVYSTSSSGIYIDPRELVQDPGFRKQSEELEPFTAEHPEIKPFAGLDR